MEDGRIPWSMAGGGRARAKGTAAMVARGGGDDAPFALRESTMMISAPVRIPTHLNPQTQNIHPALTR